MGKIKARLFFYLIIFFRTCFGGGAFAQENSKVLDSIVFNCKMHGWNFPNKEYPLSQRSYQWAYGVDSLTKKHQRKFKRRQKIYEIAKGSCFGFATTAYMAYDFSEQFEEKYPFVNADSLYFNDSSQLIVDVINSVWIRQVDCKSALQHLNLQSPKKAFTDIQSTIHCEDHSVVYLRRSLVSYHVVNPYKISQDTVNTQFYYVHVYDNNYPANKVPETGMDLYKLPIITIDVKKNRWYYTSPILDLKGRSKYKSKGYKKGLYVSKYPVSYYW